MLKTGFVLGVGGLLLLTGNVLQAEPPRKGVDVQVNPPAAQRQGVNVDVPARDPARPGVRVDVDPNRRTDGQPGVKVDVGRPGAAHPGAAPAIDRTVASRASMLKASKALGAKVRNPAGDNVGKLEDLVIEDRSGRIHYAVLGIGGFLGIGEKYFALPWGALRVSTDQKDLDDKYFVADLDKNRLKNAPGFDKDHWPDFADPRTTGEIDKHYGAKQSGVIEGFLTKGSELRGAKIHDRAGANVGSVDDFVLDINQGKVRYLALGMGGFLGIGEKLIPVPWSAAQIKHPTDNRTKAYVAIDIEQERLKRAPGFDKNEWPSFAEPFWSQEVERYYAPAPQEATRGTSRKR